MCARAATSGKNMGTFEHTLEVEPAGGGSYISVEALVDTGATFSRLPADLVERLGYAPTRRERFVLGDGRVVELGICDMKVRLEGETAITTVMIGEATRSRSLGPLPWSSSSLPPIR